LKTFEETFCEHFGCPHDAYVKEAHKRCLHSQCAVFGIVARFFAPAEDRELLVQAGALTTREELQELVDDYHYRLNLSGGFMAHRLKTRISGDRLLDLFSQVMQTKNKTG